MGKTPLVALDIGGANLKIADGNGYAASVAFPLWRQPELLPEALSRLLSAAPPAELVAVTMTGELADCFRTKAEGVSQILSAVRHAAGERTIKVYLTDGSFVAPEAATDRSLEAASSNWHALATFAARWMPGGAGLLLDIGSTTCDLIAVQAGQPSTRGKTDPERLAQSELVYTGVIRSPVCAVVAMLKWRKSVCPVAQEVFATTQDAYLMLGDLPEQPESRDTADHQPATRDHARDRLARMICADRDMFDEQDALAAAQAIRTAQELRIVTALRAVLKRMPAPPAAAVISGQGEFLARRVFSQVGYSGPVVSISEQLGSEPSRAACAHALAVLASASLGGRHWEADFSQP